MNGLVTTLFIIAALCLLPSVLVGLAAFGIAVFLVVYNWLSRAIRKRPPSSGGARMSGTGNVVYFKGRR